MTLSCLPTFYPTTQNTDNRIIPMLLEGIYYTAINEVFEYPRFLFKRFPDSKVHFTLRTRNSVHDSCFVSVIDVQSMVCANVRIHYGLQVVLVWLQVTPSRYHYYALIWRHWNIKMSVTYILSSICLRFSQFSQLSFIKYMELCVSRLHNSPAMIMRMCTLSHYHHQIGSMNH